MNSDLNLYVSAVVLAMVLVQTLFHFRKETRNLIITGAGKLIAWTFSWARPQTSRK